MLAACQKIVHGEVEALLEEGWVSLDVPLTMPMAKNAKE